MSKPAIPAALVAVNGSVKMAFSGGSSSGVAGASAGEEDSSKLVDFCVKKNGSYVETPTVEVLPLGGVEGELDIVSKIVIVKTIRLDRNRRFRHSSRELWQFGAILD